MTLRGGTKHIMETAPKKQINKQINWKNVFLLEVVLKYAVKQQHSAQTVRCKHICPINWYWCHIMAVHWCRPSGFTVCSDKNWEVSNNAGSKTFVALIHFTKQKCAKTSLVRTIILTSSWMALKLFPFYYLNFIYILLKRLLRYVSYTATVFSSTKEAHALQPIDGNTLRLHFSLLENFQEPLFPV